MEDIHFLLKYFDFRKQAKLCSFKNCKNDFFDCYIIIKRNMKKQIDKELAEVKICEEHLESKNKIIKELNKDYAKDFCIYTIKIKK